MARDFSISFLEDVSILISTKYKKAAWKGDHFSSKPGGSKMGKDFPSVHANTPTPVRISIRQRKTAKDFCNFLFIVHFKLKYLPPQKKYA
jgi:hypothetical protein